jgi:DnaK suppressor protein
MKKDRQTEMEVLLKHEIQKTEQTILDYQEMTKPIGPENAIGRVSRMDAIQNKSITEAALRQAEKKLGRLKHMLTKIDDKDFGLCNRCKQPIPFKRMLLMPQSPYCVRCASR